MIATLLRFALILSAIENPQTGNAMQAPPLAHINNTFRFEVAAPLERVAPLFGPEGERCWAGKHWDPQFVYPQPAKDVEGAVFTVAHGSHNSIWVNTIFDLHGGRMQYVSVIPEALVSVIDVQLKAIDGSGTAVEVTYARTALAAAANDEVEAMAARDRDSGAEWREGVEGCLAGKPVR
ncbi:MAG TPA: hypothetical protein VHZ25_09035 [Acidobacteriaceae bacterium]|jgi:hypothetical protein|nr:hypothetical protein [Acidobacteriaceae bacterium]